MSEEAKAKASNLPNPIRDQVSPFTDISLQSATGLPRSRLIEYKAVSYQTEYMQRPYVHLVSHS